jgi:hypothetical protein
MSFFIIYVKTLVLFFKFFIIFEKTWNKRQSFNVLFRQCHKAPLVLRYPPMLQTRHEKIIADERPLHLSREYNSSWGVYRGPKQNNTRTLRTKDDNGFRANHKIVRPQKPIEQITRIWKNQHLLLTQNQLVTMTRGDLTQLANWGWAPREC